MIKSITKILFCDIAGLGAGRLSRHFLIRQVLPPFSLLPRRCYCSLARASDAGITCSFGSHASSFPLPEAKKNPSIGTLTQ
jgi:hypothetical protein